jgi:hypothetical protein
VAALELQQSDVVVQAPPIPEQASCPTGTHCPPSQKPEQHSKPFVHTGAASGFGVAFGVAMQGAKAQKPRMFGVSACPSR